MQIIGLAGQQLPRKLVGEGRLGALISNSANCFALAAAILKAGQCNLSNSANLLGLLCFGCRHMIGTGLAGFGFV